MWWDLLVVFLAVVFLVVNAAGVVLVVFQLPGTWWMLFFTGAVSLVQWLTGSHVWVTEWGLAGLLVLAMAGEGLELMLGMVGAKGAGGSKRGAVIALIGGMFGAVLGSVLLPFLPVVAALGGAAIGAGAGSMAGDLWADRPLGQAWRAGRAAAIGRITGSIAKLAVAGLMWLVILVAVVW